MALPGSASAPAVDRRRDDYAYESGKALMNLVAKNIRARHIMTKEAFENAIAVVLALGGSTNAVLHLLAIAHEARVDLQLDDFNKMAARVPHIADTKPGGRYHMTDIDAVGVRDTILARRVRCIRTNNTTIHKQQAAQPSHGPFGPAEFHTGRAGALVANHRRLTRGTRWIHCLPAGDRG